MQTQSRNRHHSTSWSAGKRRETTSKSRWAERLVLKSAKETEHREETMWPGVLMSTSYNHHIGKPTTRPLGAAPLPSTMTAKTAVFSSASPAFT